MEERRKGQLSREEYFTLLESYRNMIELNNTLMIKVQKIIEVQDALIDTISGHRDKSEDLLRDVKHIDQSTKDTVDEISDDFKKFRETATSMIGSLITKTHMGWIGLVTIIVSLIGLGISLFGDMKQLDEITVKINHLINILPEVIK